MTYVVIAVCVALLTALICYRKKPEPEPKRFGLAQAEAAAQYIGNDPAAAKPVMGVVCGVLGYKNVVNEDLQKLREEQYAGNGKRTEEYKVNEAEIARLEAEIKKIEDANEALVDETNKAIDLVADKAKVAALFKS